MLLVYFCFCFKYLIFSSEFIQKQPQKCSMKKGVLKNFTKFTGKHMCQNLFFYKVAGLRLATLLKKDSGTGVFL